METLPIPTRRPTPATAPGYAQVHAGGVRTAYLRAGAGSPVLILAPSLDGIPPWPAFVAAVATHCRVISPSVPGPADLPGGPADDVDEPLAAWLRAFIEGLGFFSVGIVAAEPLARLALSVAARDPELVARLALVRPDAAPPLALLAEVAGRRPVAVLAHEAGDPDPCAVRDEAAIAAFFQGEG